MLNSNGLSLSDIAAVTNNDGIGGNNGWWVLIILFAIFGGWGNGWNRGGYGGMSGSGAADNYVLASDFSNIERKIDGVNNGLCDGFYAMNTGMLNGFNGVNTALAAGFHGVDNAICTLGYQTAQLNTALSNQLQQCCCDNKSAIADLKYTMAQQTQQIMQNDNANYRAFHDELTAYKMELKDSQIAEMQSKINALSLAASQQAQNNYIVNAVRPCPVPAYNVPNPYAGCGCGTCGC